MNSVSLGQSEEKPSKKPELDYGGYHWETAPPVKQNISPFVDRYMNTVSLDQSETKSDAETQAEYYGGYDWSEVPLSPFVQGYMDTMSLP